MYVQMNNHETNQHIRRNTSRSKNVDKYSLCQVH